MSRWRGAVAGAVFSRPGTAVARAVGVQPLICLGDSHIRPMREVQRARLLRRTACRVVMVSGASATGLDNLHSETQARRRFDEVTAALRPSAAVLVSLGEVDVGFLAFARAQAGDGTPSDHAGRAFDRYAAYLSGRVLARGARLLVLSASPPTIEDYATWEGLANARRLVTAGRAERAALTDAWNVRLAAWCASVGAEWLDLTPHVTVPGSLQVRPEWVNPDPLDQHLHPRRHAELLATLLRDHGFH